MTSKTPGAQPKGKRPPKVDAKAPKAKQAKAPKAQASSADKPFPPKVQRFIDEYLVDLNGTAAYQRAGYKAKPTSADANARRLLGNARIYAEIARRQAKTAENLEISREEALAEAWNIVKADPNDLIEYRRFACSACYGEQTDDRRDPNPECAECRGDGRGNVLIKDTRKLTPQARALYAGVKITKEGLEVKMHSKLDALEKIFKHLGLYMADKKVEVSGPGGGPITTQALRERSDADLLAIINGAVSK